MGEDKDLILVRSSLRQAADIRDPREMWYAVRDILNLLTMIVVKDPPVIAAQDLQV